MSSEKKRVKEETNPEELYHASSTMSVEEIELRDSINRYLSAKGYHLKLDSLHVSDTEYVQNFIPPIDEWFAELREVHSIINNKVRAWQSSKYQ